MAILLDIPKSASGHYGQSSDWQPDILPTVRSSIIFKTGMWVGEREPVTKPDILDEKQTEY